MEKPKQVNTDLIEAPDYMNYHLVNRSQKYNDHRSRKTEKWDKRTKVNMKLALVRPSDPISVLLFLHNRKMSCDLNKIHKKAATWLLWHFL